MNLERGDAGIRDRVTRGDGSFIVQAPAGSGKTSLLTLRFLRLLATVDRPEEIVAITFTRKAATEMRHRIVAALAAASGPLPADDAGEHERQLHEFASAALARSQARGWGLAEHPARLHIQTMDGLNHWLARHLPLAARIGMSVALVDDARPLYQEAARRLVARLDDAGDVAERIDRLARVLNHDPQLLVRLVAEMLAVRELWLPKLLSSHGSPVLRDEMDALLRAALRLELQAIASAVPLERLRPVLAVMREAAQLGEPDGPLAPIAGLHALPAAGLQELPRWQALANLLLTVKGAYRRKLDKNVGFPPKTAGAAWGELKSRMLAELAGLADCPELAAALQRVRLLPPDHIDDDQWERIDALRNMLPEAAAELQALFAERGQVDHAGVAAAARDALGSVDAPSELALALDYRIRHLLVDEYQDTSPAQEGLLRLLLAGWSGDDGRTLFCVGDPMQSIYAFREADVTLFLEAQRQGVGGVPLKPESLLRNFRSCESVVSWVNDTFSELLPPADDFERGAVRYSAAEHVRQDRPGAGVHVHPLLDADEQQMGRKVAELAGRLAADCGGMPGSVAILVRGRIALPPILAALREAGIDYRGVELESLAERPAMLDLVALARAMLHAADRSAWLAALRAPWCGLSLADLHALAAPDRDMPVPALLADPEAMGRLSDSGRRRARQLLDQLQPAMAERGNRSLGAWLKSGWLGIGGPATLQDPSDIANAELLFQALDRLELQVGPWPEASALESSIGDIKASPFGNEQARVQLMTIHRAKGLEFDAVIVPDLQRAPRGGERTLLYWTTVATGPGERGIVLAGRAGDPARDQDADALEAWMKRLRKERTCLELGRVAYVAATRARQQLHLLGTVQTAWQDEERQLKAPPETSLLGFFWPVLRHRYAEALAADAGNGAGEASRSRPRRYAPPVQRLPEIRNLPQPPDPALPSRLRIVDSGARGLRPDFDWAGLVAQAAGQVVHLELHRLARAGLPASELPVRPASWRRELRDLGLAEAHLEAAVQRVAQALRRVAASPTARRLLDPGHAEATSELALTLWRDGEAQSLRIDRTFVDGDGVRWIVDWKTSAHEGGDLDAFLENELARYAPQLARYAEVMKRQDPRPQQVGLYFPLLDAWRGWQPPG